MQVNSVAGPRDKSKISFQVVSRSHDSHTLHLPTVKKNYKATKLCTYIIKLSKCSSE